METNKRKKTAAKKAKSFDAVHLMRETRDAISQETQDMTFDELKAYIKSKLNTSKSKLVGK